MAMLQVFFMNPVNYFVLGKMYRFGLAVGLRGRGALVPFEAPKHKGKIVACLRGKIDSPEWNGWGIVFGIWQKNERSSIFHGDERSTNTI